MPRRRGRARATPKQISRGNQYLKNWRKNPKKYRNLTTKQKNQLIFNVQAAQHNREYAEKVIKPFEKKIMRPLGKYGAPVINKIKNPITKAAKTIYNSSDTLVLSQNPKLKALGAVLTFTKTKTGQRITRPIKKALKKEVDDYVRYNKQLQKKYK